MNTLNEALCSILRLNIKYFTVALGDVDLVKMLLQNGANISAVALNADNIFVTPLMIAGKINSFTYTFKFVDFLYRMQMISPSKNFLTHVLYLYWHDRIPDLLSRNPNSLLLHHEKYKPFWGHFGSYLKPVI